MEISKERKAFEEYLAGMKIHNLRVGTIFDTEKNEYFASDVLHPSEDHIVGWINFSWKLWQDKSTPEGFVLVDKKHTEDWYLDDHEGMWWDVDGIDNWLCDLDLGQVQAVEHKEYLITESNTLYAAKIWDESNDQVGFWEFFKTKEEAEKVAAHCKAMVEVQEKTHD